MVIGTHLASPTTPWRAAVRNSQLDSLATRVARVTGPLVVVGDLNITPYSPLFQDWLERTGLTDTRRGRTLSPSWPAHLPIVGVPIDHCAVSRDIVIVRAPRAAGRSAPTTIRFSPSSRSRRPRRRRPSRQPRKTKEPFRNEPTDRVHLVIGNEILSGKTQDANIQFLGFELSKLGIRLEEARVVRDVPEAIVRHLNECRAKFTYVFTTGGIGPTHDDITAECVALAFGVELVLDPEAVELLKRGGRPLNDARLKMARVPRGAELVANSVSGAPGFRIDNVFVFAGIPSIARAMFASAVPMLVKGSPILSASRRCLSARRRLRRAAHSDPERERGRRDRQLSVQPRGPATARRSSCAARTAR